MGSARPAHLPRASHLDEWIVPRLGQVKLRELGARRIAEWRSEILAAGCTEKQANQCLRTLSAALGAAKRYRLLPANPGEDIRRLRTSTTRARVIRPEQVEAIRARVDASRDRLSVSLLFYCALRPEEALALDLGGCGGRTLVIDKAFTHGELGPTKTHRRRSVALIPAIAAELEQHGPAGAQASLVLQSRAGTHLNLNNWRNRAWLSATRAEGQEGLRPYDGRHTFASLLIEQGRNVLEISAQLGHESATTTLKHYGHVFDESRGGLRVPMADAVAAARAFPDVRRMFGEGNVIALDVARRRRNTG
jgi:integrase